MRAGQRNLEHDRVIRDRSSLRDAEILADPFVAGQVATLEAGEDTRAWRAARGEQTLELIARRRERLLNHRCGTALHRLRREICMRVVEAGDEYRTVLLVVSQYGQGVVRGPA